MGNNHIPPGWGDRGRNSRNKPAGWGRPDQKEEKKSELTAENELSSDIKKEDVPEEEKAKTEVFETTAREPIEVPTEEKTADSGSADKDVENKADDKPTEPRFEGSAEDKDKGETEPKKPKSKKVLAAVLIPLLSAVLLAVVAILIMSNLKGKEDNAGAREESEVFSESIESSEPFTESDTETKAETEAETETEIDEFSSLQNNVGFWYHGNNQLEELHITKISDEKVYFDFRLYEKKVNGCEADLDGTVAGFMYVVPENGTLDSDAWEYGEIFNGFRSVTGSLLFDDGSVTLSLFFRGDTWETEQQITFDKREDASVLFSGAECAWAQPYADYLSAMDFPEDTVMTRVREVAFIYADDDLVPEVLIFSQFSSENPILLTIKDGEAAEFPFTAISGTIRYLESTGLILEEGGHMGGYYDMIYSVKDGTVEEVATGSRFENWKDGGEYYTWNSNEVTKNDYYDLLNSAFNIQNSKCVSKSETVSYDDALRLLGELGAVIPEEPQTDAEDVSYEFPLLVKVTVGDLLIREGPGTNYPEIGHILDRGLYYIVSVSEGEGSTAGWGKLKDGDGWVSLDYLEAADNDASDYPIIGVTLLNVDSASKAIQYGVNALGVYVYEVREGYNDAVLCEKDRIVAVNGVEVSSSQEVVDIIRTFSVGDSLDITVFRDGNIINVQAKCYSKN